MAIAEAPKRHNLWARKNQAVYDEAVGAMVRFFGSVP